MARSTFRCAPLPMTRGFSSGCSDAQFGEVASVTESDGRLTQGALVRHPRFGPGVVEFDKGPTTIVRFDRGLEECERGTLDVRLSLEQAIAQRQWSGALEVVTKAQGSRNRIAERRVGRFLPLANYSPSTPALDLSPSAPAVARSLPDCRRRRSREDGRGRTDSLAVAVEASCKAAVDSLSGITGGTVAVPTT